MQSNQITDLAHLQTEVNRLRQALWELIVAVDELAYVVEFSREQESGTRPVLEAIARARDILGEPGHARTPASDTGTPPRSGFSG
ncbi:MAG TPA: hypothetical protein VKY56_09995 [Chloroflexota bacterium]|nr:hypothetical protein [Chloroflexota bacterium]